MLTPQEISERELVKAVFGGYDTSVVDDFLETVTADYSALYKENAILKSKIKVLVEKVEEYRSTEDSMRMALLTAQKMGDELLANAKEKSETLVKEAQEKSDSMTKRAKEESEATLAAAREEGAKLVADLKAQIAAEEARLAVAKNATAAFVRQSRELAGKIDKFLESVPGLEMKKPEEAPAPKKEPAPVEEPAAEAPVSDREEKIADAAEAINDAVTKITEDEPEISEEPVKLDDVDLSSFAKFDFDNLRFGITFDEE